MGSTKDITTTIDWELAPFPALAEGADAAVHGFWWRSIGYWQDQFNRKKYRRAAAYCLVEAGLETGKFDLADRMMIQLGEPDSYLTELNERTIGVRKARRQWFEKIVSGEILGDSRERVEQELSLALFEDAIRTAQRLDFGSGEFEAYLVRALFGLGAHSEILGVADRTSCASNSEINENVTESREKLARWNSRQAFDLDEFCSAHGAGQFLRAELLLRDFSW